MFNMTDYPAGSIVLALDRDGHLAQAEHENTLNSYRTAHLVAVLTPNGELHVVKDRNGPNRTFRAGAVTDGDAGVGGA